jgi:multidrug efflux pump
VAPLVVAGGAGAGSRHSLGSSVFFGMLGATTLGVFFIPLFFYSIRSLVERRTARQPVVAPQMQPAFGD